MQSTCYSYKVLIKLEFSIHIFEKFSNIKVCENTSRGIRVCSARRDGRTYKVNCCFFFSNFANAPEDNTG